MNNIFKIILNNVKQVHSSIEDRADATELRISALQNIVQPIVKNAFDTRRINQDTDFNPRRNLQHYHRSTPFITKDAAEQIKTFFKLKTAIDSIKEQFIGDSEWLDSYARILSTALDRTLRIDQKDMDFFQPQMDYLNEMIYLRYRLSEDDLNKMSETELKNIILNKDEKLLHKQIFAQYDNKSIKKETTEQPLIKSIKKETIHQPVVENLKKETMQQSNDIVTGQQEENQEIISSGSNSLRSKNSDRPVNITINVA
jgi:hypothetical protein